MFAKLLFFQVGTRVTIRALLDLKVREYAQLISYNVSR
jgi:hypothetical protein